MTAYLLGLLQKKKSRFFTQKQSLSFHRCYLMVQSIANFSFFKANGSWQAKNIAERSLMVKLELIP
jgi:hypothetical protein